MAKNKCSCITHPDAIKFLVNNGIPFVCRKGIQRGHFMLYFISDEETAEELHINTGCTVYDEIDGWDFNHWEAIN